MEKHFTLEYWIDDNWYVGRIKEIPGVFSQGETLDELELNIHDAYTMILGDNNKKITLPSETNIKDFVVQV